jgi:predicted deacylase
MTAARAEPDFPVEIAPPDLEPWRAGNIGVPYFHRFDSGRPGPHCLVTALVHGNELSGAVALDRLLREGPAPRAGRLTLGFVNVAAYAAFDPADPQASRYLEEDFNRLWQPAALDGPRRSAELDRARQIRPLVDEADILLDLHSMQVDAEPLMLAGPLAKGRRLAQALGYPALVVCDAGHAEGTRLRDYGRFADPQCPQTALLAECGQHWAKATASVAEETVRRLLGRLGLGPPVAPPPGRPRIVEVTHAVTVATGRFRFLADFAGLEEIAEAGTPIAVDGDRPVVTPYDRCVLVMPSRRLNPGRTAVRLGRDVTEARSGGAAAAGKSP